MTHQPEPQRYTNGDVACPRPHWGGAYKVTGPQGALRAERLDGQGVLDSPTRRERWDPILADYREPPTPRGTDAAGADPATAGIHHEVTAEERLGRIDALDLEPVVYKLMHPEPGADALSLAQADRDVAMYRYFWKLCLLEPGATLVPSRELDNVWHTHMLDTAKYRADCDWVFGSFLDHFPYFGFRGVDDRLAWQQGFVSTRQLFRDHFGIDIVGQPAASACSAHGGVADCCIGCTKPPPSEVRPRPDRNALVPERQPAGEKESGARS